MDDVLLVDVLHALQDLLHVAGAGRFRVLKVFVRDAFKQLPACDTGRTNALDKRSLKIRWQLDL